MFLHLFLMYENQLNFFYDSQCNDHSCYVLSEYTPEELPRAFLVNCMHFENYPLKTFITVW